MKMTRKKILELIETEQAKAWLNEHQYDNMFKKSDDQIKDIIWFRSRYNAYQDLIHIIKDRDWKLWKWVHNL